MSAAGGRSVAAAAPWRSLAQRQPWPVALTIPSLLLGVLGLVAVAQGQTSFDIDVAAPFLLRTAAAAADSTTGEAVALRSLAQHQVLSIWGMIRELLDLHERLLAGVLLAFSGVWPLAKQGLVLLLWVVPLPVRWAHGALAAIDAVGKWSMVDVFLVGLLMVTLKLDIQVLTVHATLRVHPHRGVYLYAAAVLLSLALTALIRRMAAAALAAEDATALAEDSVDAPDKFYAGAKAAIDGDGDPEGEEGAAEDPSEAGSLDRFLPTERGPSTWAEAAGFAAAILVAILCTLGLFLPICRVRREVLVTGAVEQTAPSAVGLTLLMYREHGDPVLLILQAALVCLLPLVRCWSVVVLWRRGPGRRRRVADALQPWAMCDVFLLTLVVLSLRLGAWVADFAAGYAAITAAPYAMPGYWCALTAAVADALLRLHARSRRPPDLSAFSRAPAASAAAA